MNITANISIVTINYLFLALEMIFSLFILLLSSIQLYMYTSVTYSVSVKNMCKFNAYTVSHTVCLLIKRVKNQS